MRLIRLLRKDLAREISLWVDQHLITAEQARSICGLYEVDFDAATKSAAGYSKLLSLGFLFIGIAIILVVSHNWEEIPRWVRMGGLVALTLATHAIAFRLLCRDRIKAAKRLFFLGNLFYGASIILIAQIYHLGEQASESIFWWALGSLPFGVLLLDPWLTLFSVLLALLWFWQEWTNGYFPALFALFLSAALFVLFMGRRNALLLLITMIGCALWLDAIVLPVWRDDPIAGHLVFGVSFFILAAAIGHWLHGQGSGKAKDYGVLIVLWSLRFTLLSLVVLSFESTWEAIIETDWDKSPQLLPVIIFCVAAALWTAHKSGTLQLLTAPAAIILLAWSATLAVNGDISKAIFFQIASNFILVGWGVWLVWRGLQGGISHYYFLGVMCVLVVAFLRYFDLVAGYIGTAVLFVGLAVLLIGAGLFWRRRAVRGQI